MTLEAQVTENAVTRNAQIFKASPMTVEYNTDTLDAMLVRSILDEQKAKLLMGAYKDKQTEIKHEGDAIILPVLPKYMTEEEALLAIQRKIKLDSENVAINEEIDAYPLEGAFAFMQVLKEKFGWVSTKEKETIFGKKPPQMISLEVAPGKYEQVIWGQFELPQITGHLETGATEKRGRYIFCIKGEVKKKHQVEIKLLAEIVREYVRAHSIYRGKAIRLKTDQNGIIDPMEAPSFIDTSKVKDDELVFSEEVLAQINTSVFTPVEKTEVCRKHGVPLKRGILLEGPYGTGKTLTAYVAAKKAVENKWTFIYLDKVTGLKEALIFAKQYQPAIVFAEDIDKATSGTRTLKMDEILNNIDGIDSKNAEVMTVLTTNFVESIDKAMIRPGRLDAVIHVSPPDAKAVEKLLRIYGRGLIKKTEDLEKACDQLKGQIPAVIREVVERAKLYAFGRMKDADEKLTLTGSDLYNSAIGMKHHLSLMAPAKQEEETPALKMANAMVSFVREGFNGSAENIKSIQTKVERIEDKIC